MDRSLMMKPKLRVLGLLSTWPTGKVPVSMVATSSTVSRVWRATLDFDFTKTPSAP